MTMRMLGEFAVIGRRSSFRLLYRAARPRAHSFSRRAQNLASWRRQRAFSSGSGADEPALWVAARAQGRQQLGIDRDFNAARDARLASNQAGAVQREHHLVDRAR